MKIIEGRVTSKFGGRRDPIDGTYKIHQGVDIAAPLQTAVYSPAAGVVSSIHTHIAGGLTLVIRSGCGQVRYAMCHLGSVVVEQGQFVTQGELIAKSGNSGRSTGAHLHFSVKTGGKWYAEQYVGGSFVDPVPYVEF